MLERAVKDFERYFLTINNKIRGGRGSELFSIFINSQSRNQINTILEDRLYLSNLQSMSNFKNYETIKKEDNAALIVSCIDVYELTRTNTLTEPASKRIKYHLLAMEDNTAKVGSDDHVYEALALMSTFADEKKPILIHCYSGIGRSAMMTALHLAHRYLLKDPIVMACLDPILEKNKKANTADTDFTTQLYFAAANYIESKRHCVKFNSGTRNRFAISLLNTIHNRIKQNKPIVNEVSADHQFMAELVQTLAFKKLLQRYSQAAHFDVFIENISKFFNAFLKNDDAWCVEINNDYLAEFKEQIELLSAKYPSAAWCKQLVEFNYKAAEDVEVLKSYHM